MGFWDMLSWATGGTILSALSKIAKPAFDWWSSRRQPFLGPTLEPFNDRQMLRAFSVTLKNVSSVRIRLESIFIRVPKGAEFAISWHVPIMILGDISSPSIEWERSREYAIGQSLDPGEAYDCEIGIPPSFAVSASRRPPVTIAVKLTTLGAEERTLVQDIKRQISVA
jgi:hypothetical protein